MATAVAAATGSGKTQEIIFVNKPTKEIDFNYLKEITDDFSKDRINWGEIACKEGIKQGGEAIIVVKKFQQKAPVITKERDNHVITKERLLQIIVALKHENIVKFIGYCSKPRDNQGTSSDEDTVESYLCYEYLSKGSLHENLSDESVKIDWDDRFKIIGGICQGLFLLHELEHPIIHMDLKPENILLDDKLAPKIADFGLVIQLDNKQDHPVLPDIAVGSYGCMAPEYPYSKEISVKSDIYRLGLLIIEITTREKIYPDDQPSARKYIDKICEKWTEEHIASEYPELDSYCLQQVKACIKIGLECVEIDPNNRPSIDKIVDELNKRDV